MSKFFGLLTMALGLTLTSSARADDTSVNSVDSLEFMEGNWICTDPNGGSNTNSNDQIATIHVHRVLGDWFAAKVTKFGSKDGEAIAFMTYDAENQVFVDMGLCDKGSYGIVTAEGWKNNSLVFEGEVRGCTGKQTMVQKTFTKQSDGSLEMIFATSTDGKTYSVQHAALCKR